MCIMETKQIFATRTKTLRKERGLSQTELAAALWLLDELDAILEER